MKGNKFENPESNQDQRFETESREDLIRRIEALEAANKELAEKNELLEKIATKDPLTGAYNRRGFEEEISHIIPETLSDDNEREERRSKTNSSMLMLDIDNFKKINDTYGHDAGDEILRQAAKFLKENTRKTDIICRWGGEEFIVVLQNVNTKKVIQKFYNKEENQAQIKFTAMVDGKEIPVTFSGGTTEIIQEKNAHETMEENAKMADSQLYRAKKEGKNRIYRPEEKKF